MKKMFLILIPFFFLLFLAFVFFIKKGSPTSQISRKSDVVTQSDNPKIEILDNNVYLEAAGATEWTDAKDQQEIKPGTVIKTDTNGHAQLIYPNGTVTRLDSNTQIILKTYQASPQQVNIFVEAGTIWSRITKLLGGESYQSESTNLVATVRGTVYTHQVLATGEDNISVTSHSVHINCEKTKLESDVTEDSETQTNCKTK